MRLAFNSNQPAKPQKLPKTRRAFIGGWLVTLLVASLFLQISQPPTANATGLTPSAEDAAIAAQVSSPYVPGQVVIKLVKDYQPAALAANQVPAELQTVFANIGVKDVAALGNNTNIYRLEIDVSVAEALKSLKAEKIVEWAEPNYLKQVQQATPPITTNDPLFDRQWHLQIIQAPQAWTITTGSKDVVVAVVDSGIDETHPDLAGKTVKRYDFNRERPDVIDQYGHGTEVSSFITANTNNGQGIAGLNWNVSLLNMRAGDAFGSLQFWDIARAVILSTESGARIINGSYGGGGATLLDQAVVNYASVRGVVQVYSSGNGGYSSPEYPAALVAPGVMAIGATDINDKVVGFSTFGPQVSVVAPGSGVWGATLGGGYAGTNGTSFSAPIVSGVAALILSVNPKLTAVDVKNIIEGTSDDISGVGWTAKTGWGRVNAYKAVLAAQAGDTTPNKKSVISGRVSGVDPKLVTISLDPFGVKVPVQADGTYRLEGLGKATYQLRAAVKGSGTTGVNEIKLSGQAGDNQTVNFAFQNIAAQGTAPIYVDQARFFDKLTQEQAQQAVNSGKSYYQETGHSLGGTFRAFWQNNGGLAVFGFPISEEFSEVSLTDGKVYRVQYFERNRFEYHPENVGTNFEVQLGLLGKEQTADRKFATASPGSSGLYFKETGHNLSGQFLDYWQRNGGLAIFGYPISESITENGLTVQWFERNRFEYHPENADTKYQVLLGLLGKNLARQRGYIG